MTTPLQPGTLVSDLADGVRAGRMRAIARAISLVENDHPDAEPLLAALYPATGRARTIGVTGPPGAGKSTFVDRLVEAIRADGQRVGVIAVDPASPFTGGAILGDRVRMATHQSDPGVFIRSMSSRGHLGGLAAATESAVAVLDAAGFDVVVVETVGVGQSEIEVAELADTTVLVQPPGLGDGVQAVKAGIMEVPAVFVVNKADLPGAKQVANEIEQVLSLGPVPDWRPPILLVSSTAGAESGAPEVWQAIQRHQRHLGEGDRLLATRTQRAERLIRQAALRHVERWLRKAAPVDAAAALTRDVAERRRAPHLAAQALVRAAVAAEPLA